MSAHKITAYFDTRNAGASSFSLRSPTDEECDEVVEALIGGPDGDGDGWVSIPDGEKRVIVRRSAVYIVATEPCA